MSHSAGGGSLQATPNKTAQNDLDFLGLIDRIGSFYLDAKRAFHGGGPNWRKESKSTPRPEQGRETQRWRATIQQKEFPDETLLACRIVGDGDLWVRGCHARRRPGNRDGRGEGTAPATVEGYGLSWVIVCNEGGYCWHSPQRYEYPPNAQVVIHPYNWRWHEGDRYASREHAGRGYWQGDEWQGF